MLLGRQLLDPGLEVPRQLRRGFEVRARQVVDVLAVFGEVKELGVYAKCDQLAHLVGDAHCEVFAEAGLALSENYQVGGEFGDYRLLGLKVVGAVHGLLAVLVLDAFL